MTSMTGSGAVAIGVWSTFSERMRALMRAAIKRCVTGDHHNPAHASARVYGTDNDNNFPLFPLPFVELIAAFATSPARSKIDLG
jgi:hypothetical protein